MGREFKTKGYPPKFKLKALKLANKIGVGNAARKMGCDYSSLNKWVREALSLKKGDKLLKGSLAKYIDGHTDKPSVIHMNLLDDEAPITPNYPGLGGYKERKLKDLEAEIEKLKSTVKFLLNLN